MTNMSLRYIRFLLVIALSAGIFQVASGSTRLTIVHAAVDNASRHNFEDALGSIQEMPGIELIRLTLDDLTDDGVTRLLLAAAPAGGPLRLAAAGGTIGTIGPIAILYPDIGEPYRSVFSKIIEGIEERAQTRVSSYAVGNNFNAQAISSELKRQDIRVVIALGRNGLRAASALDKEIGVVVGGVVSVMDAEMHSNAVLSLAPDPALLFARLKLLSPKTQRIFVVFEPRQNGWLIRLAKDAARNQGIELVALEATDLKGALGLYQSIFATADAKRDALWLPQDSATVDESLVLPLVLQESWKKGMPVFSSNVSHVKRGALFALYPNNMELGRNLATSALGMTSGNSTTRGVLPLRDVLTAFNTRTASHLGLSPASAQQQGFDLLFPER